MFRDAMLPFVGARSAEVQTFTAGERLFVDDTVDHPLVAGSSRSAACGRASTSRSSATAARWAC